MIAATKALKVRGAPLIGVAAAFSLAQTMRTSLSIEEFKKAANELKASRPTAINLMVAIDRILKVAEKSFTLESIEKSAIDFFEEDVKLCQQIAKNGAPLIPDNSSILTHCNTGGLATAGVGTALGVIGEAHKQGKKVHVYVDETRPLLQGGRLTTWELEKQGIPYTLICDNTAASLMARGEISMAIVGADRVARNGDFANKIGTYGIAVLCYYHRVPFYMAAPYTTFDFNCVTGKDIPIEKRSALEVQGIYGQVDGLNRTTSEDIHETRDKALKKAHKTLASSQESPKTSQKSDLYPTKSWGKFSKRPISSDTQHLKTAPVYNPAFDVTPCELVQGWIFDTGVLNQQNWDEEINRITKNKIR